MFAVLSGHKAKLTLQLRTTFSGDRTLCRSTQNRGRLVGDSLLRAFFFRGGEKRADLIDCRCDLPFGSLRGKATTPDRGVVSDLFWAIRCVDCRCDLPLGSRRGWPSKAERSNRGLVSDLFWVIRCCVLSVFVEERKRADRGTPAKRCKHGLLL